PKHCGGCSAECSLPHVADYTCKASSSGSACGVKACDAGFADCDGTAANGCETDLTRLSDCGRCGNSCVSTVASSACRDGKCIETGCADGFARCAGTCRDVRSDPQNCGACGTVCSSSTPYCAGGRCTSTQCAAHTADCDGGAQNACETNLGDADNCGSC